MGKEVEVYFDYASPASYLGYTQLPALARRTGAVIRLRPMLVGAVFKAVGNQPPLAVPAKLAWLNRDLQRWARRYGVPFNPSPFFPVNSVNLMRGAIAAAAEGALEAYSDVVFRGVWVERRDLADPAEAARALAEAGLDADRFTAAIADEAVKRALREATDEAIGRGVFGAPTFFVGDELFWGQDRLDFVAAALGA